MPRGLSTGSDFQSASLSALFFGALLSFRVIIYCSQENSHFIAVGVRLHHSLLRPRLRIRRRRVLTRHPRGVWWWNRWDRQATVRSSGNNLPPYFAK
jgi:hypothetical protein